MARGHQAVPSKSHLNLAPFAGLFFFFPWQAHDMDMFWCVALMLLVSSALNVRKSKGGDVLNREQTEEWKGWMQFMFLMYHYFSAHEVLPNRPKWYFFTAADLAC